jgi:hypothetical protein
MGKLTSQYTHRFRGAGVPTAFGSAGPDPFRVSLSTGTATKNANGLRLAVTSAASAQHAELNQGDILAYSIDELIRVEFEARIDQISGGFTNSEVAIGLASARNATISTISQFAMFRLKGNTNLLLEIDDDGANNVDDYDSGIDVTFGQWQRFAIDFATGVKTQAPPFISKGGKSSITWFANGAGISKEYLEQINPSIGFDLGAYSGGLQLYARIGKSGGTDEPALTIRNIHVEVKDN